MKTDNKKDAHSLTKFVKGDSFGDIIEFYDGLPVVTLLCDPSFTICWKNRAAQKWAEGELRDLLYFSSAEREQIFLQMQECKQVETVKTMGLTSCRLCFRQLNSEYFLIEIQRQEQLRPFLLDQRENLLLASFEENVRLWVSNIFALLETIKKSLQISEKYREADLVDIIFENCMSILKFIETYSDYQALLESDLQEAISLDVCRELKNICEVVKAQMQLENIPFSFDSIPDEVIICKVKPREFRRAILHLLSNAFKFTSPDNAVTVKAFQQKNRFIIQVSDKGTGIPMQDFDKIFDPFYSYDPNTRMSAGAGIGLSYVKAFMEKYHQEKTRPILESREHAGTKVVISLPVEKDPQSYIPYDDGSDHSDILRGKYSVYQVYLSDVLNQLAD